MPSRRPRPSARRPAGSSAGPGSCSDSPSACLLLLVAVAVLLRYARHQSATAKREKTAALRTAAEATYFGLTASAQSQLSTRPDVSLLLYLAAYDNEPTAAPPSVACVATLHSAQLSGAVGILHGHTDAVESIAFSPVDSTLASASGDKTIRLWRVEPAAATTRRDRRSEPRARCTASRSIRPVRRWRRGASTTSSCGTSTGTRDSATIRDSTGAVTSVAFSRHGNMLAAGEL